MDQNLTEVTWPTGITTDTLTFVGNPANDPGTICMTEAQQTGGIVYPSGHSLDLQVYLANLVLQFNAMNLRLPPTSSTLIPLEPM
jgi:hypothetical protein